MSKQAKFCDVPDGYVPPNRRVYENAKKPFGWLWSFVSWIGLPFLQALPFTLMASFVVNVFLHTQDGSNLLSSKVAFDVIVVGLVWMVYVGGLFLALKALRALTR